MRLSPAAVAPLARRRRRAPAAASEHEAVPGHVAVSEHEAFAQPVEAAAGAPSSVQDTPHAERPNGVSRTLTGIPAGAIEEAAPSRRPLPLLSVQQTPHVPDSNGVSWTLDGLSTGPRSAA